MAYGDGVKIRAYALFIRGTSFEETARRLCGEFGISISAATVRNWAEEKDASGSSWADYRRELRVSAQRSVEALERNKLLAVRDKAGILQEKLFEQLTSNAALKVGSVEGGLYAWKTVADFFVKMDEKSKGTVNAAAVIQMMLDLFSSIPEVSEAIAAHWQEIEEEIRVRILHEEPNGSDKNRKLLNE